MMRYPLWAVLAPGEPSWLERRARDIDALEEDEAPTFEVIRGSGSYHAIVGLEQEVGAEWPIAEQLSLECEEPVYSIDRANDPWIIMKFQRGKVEALEVDPETLANSLGCPLPGSKEPSDFPERQPLRHVALVEGVRADEAYRVLEEEAGEPLATGRYRLEDTPRGLIISSDTYDIGFADITVSERLPHATAYAVLVSPGMGVFVVSVLQGGECIGQFAQPPREGSFMPVVSEIKGERSPERILAALGIPAEWFLNE